MTGKVEHTHVHEDGEFADDFKAGKPVTNTVSNLWFHSSKVLHIVDLSEQLQSIADIGQERSQWEYTREESNKSELAHQLHVVIDDGSRRIGQLLVAHGLVLPDVLGVCLVLVELSNFVHLLFHKLKSLV